ncbi:hypothetical protein AWC38_SpisGene14192 [Stylophora pistillata]|uniref:Uncharacterized protein n=1 Tax=Stylophora pistillata TaxID=50429 RepID=A0A2B4RXN4_STYPI|nr:hypothetical protein AWC38_SpisGene14192 [Stylophora pistillata]
MSRTQLPSIFPWSKAKLKHRELVELDVPSKRRGRKPPPTKSVCVELHNVEGSSETFRKEIEQQRNPKDVIVPEDIIEIDGIEDKTDQVHRSQKEENNVETLKDLKAKLESLEKDLEECKQQLCSANKELDQLKESSALVILELEQCQGDLHHRNRPFLQDKIRTKISGGVKFV